MADEAINKQDQGSEAASAVFEKAQLLCAKKYRNKRDILSAVLTDGESYTFDTVDELINKFLKNEVK